MLRGRQRTNPFYALLIAVGVAFTVTASAYFVMALRGSAPPGAAAGQQPHRLLEFMDRHGFQLMAGELVILALATCAAIGTDSWWNPANRHSPQGAGADDKRHPESR